MALNTKVRTKWLSEQLPLERDPWVVVRYPTPKTGLKESIQTLGFARYEKPELRIHVSPYASEHGMMLIRNLGITHMQDTISEGEFSVAELEHPTGEPFRFLARKCKKEELLTVYDTIIESSKKLGAPQTNDEFYRNGILDIIPSDEDNLLPGESGYDTSMDVVLKTANIH